MAVTTRNERFSLIALSLGQGRVVSNPDGAISDSAERAQWALSYARGFGAAVTFLPSWAINSNRLMGLKMEPD
jgi:hypothetical protein